MRATLIVTLTCVLMLAAAGPVRALEPDTSAPDVAGRDPGSIVLNEMFLAAVSGMAIFSPRTYGGLLLISAPVLHFASGRDAHPLLRWGMPLFYVALGAYNMTVLEDNSSEEARIFRENFVAWNGLYIYALTRTPRTDGGPVSAGVTALPGRLMLTASLRF